MKKLFAPFILCVALITSICVHAQPVATSSPPDSSFTLEPSASTSDAPVMVAQVGGDAPTDSTAKTGDAVSDVASSFIVGVAIKYPWVVTVLSIIGILRVLFKPIMSAIEKAVANDPAKSAHLQEFEAGPVFRVIAWVLDFGASIKLKPAISNAVAKP